VPARSAGMLDAMALGAVLARLQPLPLLLARAGRLHEQKLGPGPPHRLDHQVALLLDLEGAVDHHGDAGREQLLGAGQLVVTRVPAGARAMEVLRGMQRRGEHLAVVEDEIGRTSGIVSLEDLLEELVGEIRSED